MNDLSGFRGLKVLVVGDVMLDRHLRGHVRRISPEAPVPVVSFEEEDTSPGGAGHVAASLAGLGCRVSLAGLIGDDPDGRQLRLDLRQRGVNEIISLSGSALSTICKTRILSQASQQLLRLDRDGNRDAFAAKAGELLVRILEIVEGYDAVVLADYDKGAVTAAVAEAVIRSCRARGTPCVVDPKNPAVENYRGATVLAPNVLECERALGRPLLGDEAVAQAAEEVRLRLGLDAMLITRGADGMTIAPGDGASIHIPAESRDVADVTGAGDTVVAVLAAGLGSGWPVVEASRLASKAAGIAVGRRGTYVVKMDELERSWQGVSPKVVGRDSARRRALEVRSSEQKVVFTNGCFDILHAGHLSSLERSRALGDFLIVGLNSDSSVRLNKGHTRPIIGECDRAALLAGLACVDLVVVFDEPTPQDLIRAVEPDVLVKGEDYNPDAIAGAEFVRSRGGRVVTLPLVPGLSSSSILSRVQSVGSSASSTQCD